MRSIMMREWAWAILFTAAVYICVGSIPHADELHCNYSDYEDTGHPTTFEEQYLCDDLKLCQYEINACLGESNFWTELAQCYEDLYKQTYEARRKNLEVRRLRRLQKLRCGGVK